MTEYFLFYARRYLVKVVNHAEAFQFLDGRWNPADIFASKVSGMGGDADFESITPAEAKKLFPTSID